MAKGKDPEYIKWFETIVNHAERGDFPLAYSEFFLTREWKFRSGEPLSYPPFTPTSIDELPKDFMGSSCFGM